MKLVIVAWLRFFIVRLHNSSFLGHYISLPFEANCVAVSMIIDRYCFLFASKIWLCIIIGSRLNISNFRSLQWLYNCSVVYVSLGYQENSTQFILDVAELLHWRKMLISFESYMWCLSYMCCKRLVVKLITSVSLYILPVQAS